MKTLTLHMIVIERAQCMLNRNKQISRMNSGSQTRGPHVAREGILCSPWCFLGIL